MNTREAAELRARAEAVRRHGDGTLNVVPIPPSARWPADGPPDYASAGVKIEHAMMILNEALPNGQRERAKAGYELLKLGWEELTAFLTEKGLFKPAPDGATPR